MSKVLTSVTDGSLIIFNQKTRPFKTGKRTARPRKQLKGRILRRVMEHTGKHIEKIIVDLYFDAHPNSIKDIQSTAYNAFFTWNMFYCNNRRIKFCDINIPLRYLKIEDIKTQNRIVDLQFGKQMLECTERNINRTRDRFTWSQGTSEAKQNEIVDFYAEETKTKGFHVEKNQRFKFDLPPQLNARSIQDEIDILIFDKNKNLIEIVEVETIDTSSTVMLGSIVNLNAFTTSKDCKRTLVIGGESQRESKFKRFCKSYIDPLKKSFNCEINCRFIPCTKEEMPPGKKTKNRYIPIESLG